MHASSSLGHTVFVWIYYAVSCRCHWCYPTVHPSLCLCSCHLILILHHHLGRSVLYTAPLDILPLFRLSQCCTVSVFGLIVRLTRVVRILLPQTLPCRLVSHSATDQFSNFTVGRNNWDRWIFIEFIWLHTVNVERDVRVWQERQCQCMSAWMRHCIVCCRAVCEWNTAMPQLHNWRDSWVFIMSKVFWSGIRISTMNCCCHLSVHLFLHSSVQSIRNSPHHRVS